MVKCNCSCCEDAVERSEYNRNVIDACWCFMYIEDERCDCLFCRLCMNVGQVKEKV